MSNALSLDELKKHQPGLIGFLLKDYGQERACELANSMLRDLDNLEKIEEDYIDVQKNDDRLAERVRIKVRGMADLR